MTILYLSYDGLTDPLGRSQILPYLVGLSARGHRFVVLSFEKREAMVRDGALVRGICRTSDIQWHPNTYTKSPPIASTLANLWSMFRQSLTLITDSKITMIHARSYPAALVALRLGTSTGLPWIFDMRGFWADERREARLWPDNNPLYRFIYQFFKRQELLFLEQARHIISLTASGLDQICRISPHPVSEKTSIIPCCTDFKLFDPDQYATRHRTLMRKQAGIPADAFLLVYLGSLGTWYRLPEMMSFFSNLLEQKPNAYFLLLTKTEEAVVYHTASVCGIDKRHLIIRQVDRMEVPAWLSIANLGISLLQNDFSKTGSSPVKLGEMLAMGLPVVCNDIGDCRELIVDGFNGFLLPNLDELTLKKAARASLSTSFAPPAIIRESSRDKRSLEWGIEQYDAVYKKMTSG